MIPLIRPTYDEKSIDPLKQWLKNGRWRDGEKAVRNFETAFAEHFQVSYARAVNSGTSALHLALLAMDICEKDEVIIPTYTCLAVLNAVLYTGAKPVLTDNAFEPQNMNFNVSAAGIRKNLTRKTKAIIVPHLFGALADIQSIRSLGVPVVEDATLSLGARLNGRPAGSIGNISVCSLFKTKMVSADQGGIVATGSNRYAAKLGSLCDYEKDVVSLRLKEKKYFRRSIYKPGYSYGMSAWQAMMGSAQLRQLGNFVKRRIQIAKFYDRALTGSDAFLPAVRGDGSVVYQRYMVCVKKKPETIIKKMRAFGVELGRGVYPPLHYVIRSGNSFPNAERCLKFLVSIPIYPDLSDDEARFIAARFHKVVGGRS